MLQEIKEEITARLAKAKSKEEKFKIVKELESKEKVVQRKLILAKIKENTMREADIFEQYVLSNIVQYLQKFCFCHLNFFCFTSVLL